MTDRRRSRILGALVATLLCATVAAAADPATKCKTDKMIAAGVYDLCLLRTTARAMRAGTAPDLTKCNTTFSTKWSRAEAKAAGACPTTGDAAALASQVNADVNAIIAALTPSSTTTTVSTTTTTSTTILSCGTFPGCGGTCAAGLSCWASIVPGPASVCQCLPASATPCASTGGSIFSPTCGGACPAGESCSMTFLEESLTAQCGCIPSGQPACLSFTGPCGGACPTGMSCAPDPLQLLACVCQ